jgi:hypothetical protein
MITLTSGPGEDSVKSPVAFADVRHRRERSRPRRAGVANSRTTSFGDGGHAGPGHASSGIDGDPNQRDRPAGDRQDAG